MPAWAVRCKFLVDIEVFGGPWMDDSLPAQNKSCVVCESARAAGVDQLAGVSCTDVFVCYMCLTSWHEDCARCDAVKTGASLHLGGQGEGLDAHPKPHAFLCEFCAGRQKQ